MQNAKNTPKKSLYFTKALQCKVIKSLVIYWIKVRELWVLYRCVLHQFSVSPHMYTPILPDKLQKITKRFQCGHKTVTNWNIERIMQFFKIAVYMKVANCMAWYIMRFVHFAIYARLAVCSCECGRSSCLCSLWPCGHWESESVSVFDGFMYL